MNVNTSKTETSVKCRPIEDYAFISDCHSVALISRQASIDWCCMPRIDSSSVFGRLLDWNKGGVCYITPTTDFVTNRRYRDHSLVLETTFITNSGKARITDCFTMREGGRYNPHRQILRVIDGLEGELELECMIEPRFDYGVIKPWFRRLTEGQFIVTGGSNGLLVSGDVDFRTSDRHACRTRFTVRKGTRLRLSIMHRPPEELDALREEIPDAEELDSRLEETLQWWHNWSSQGTYKGVHSRTALRSAVVLKGLCNVPTGAIAAAATTSLPEAIPGNRNWDYRFSWIRDSVFTARSLSELGYHNEADGFRRFVERSTAGSVEQIQILYGVGGERRLSEANLTELAGYCGTRPVRIGNAAVDQVQLDIYGELLDLAWRWHLAGNSPDDDYWEFIEHLTEKAIKLWERPDCGIWELRGRPRHFVLSKAMCCVAVDRAIKLAEDIGMEYPQDRWKTARQEILNHIMENGVDKDHGRFKQAYDNSILDASLLLLPIYDFIPYDHEVMLRTTDGILEELEENGLIRRYPSHSDGIEGGEGVFVACTFWLVECLAAQGKLEQARQHYEIATSTANDLGLFSEEYDTHKGIMLGNFPQGLTHLSHISATVALDKARREQHS